MDPDLHAALHRNQVIDLTTTGRRTGQPRRIEIVLLHHEGTVFISGKPVTFRTRDWLRNVEAEPHVTVHLKQEVVADVPATARVVTDPLERRPLLEAAARVWSGGDLALMMEHSPLIVLRLDDPDGGPRAPSDA